VLTGFFRPYFSEYKNEEKNGEAFRGRSGTFALMLKFVLRFY
jgi:hypothetical protein